ncbi:hypothetical protein BDQ17DRAFT_1249004 [Cyathus striatus]|nr:hypothetical protein BDQ17DRAFT_1249004 [Cyathus striatus]
MNGKEHYVPPGSWPPKDRAAFYGRDDDFDDSSVIPDVVGKASVFKEEGNKAFARKDRQGTVKAYDSALALLTKDNNPEEHSQEWKRLTAVCYTNRSAAMLFPGEGLDAERAIKDGEGAVRWDPTYAKGYYRISKAHEYLGNLNAAQDVIVQALVKPALRDDDVLASYLIELQTGGKELSTDEKEFNSWLYGVLSEHQKKGIALKGAWQKKWMAHKASLKKN